MEGILSYQDLACLSYWTSAKVLCKLTLDSA
jgi:hypothetical protein